MKPLPIMQPPGLTCSLVRQQMTSRPKFRQHAGTPAIRGLGAVFRHWAKAIGFYQGSGKRLRQAQQRVVPRVRWCGHGRFIREGWSRDMWSILPPSIEPVDDPTIQLNRSLHPCRGNPVIQACRSSSRRLGKIVLKRELGDKFDFAASTMRC